MESDDWWFMKLAIQQAEEAYKIGEVPIGSILVNAKGQVVAEGYNTRETKNNCTGHAEIQVMSDGSKKNGSWRLLGHTLYCTLEPCLMCIGAMQSSRLSRLVFGAYDFKGGALSLGYCVFKDFRLNHRFSVLGGLDHFRCSELMSQFFKELRHT